MQKNKIQLSLIGIY